MKMIQGVNAQVGIKIANADYERQTSNKKTVKTENDESNTGSKIKSNECHLKYEVECQKCKILAQYKKVVERYQYFTNEMQDVLQGHVEDNEAISSIRVILDKFTDLNLAVGQISDLSTEENKIFKLDDKCVSLLSGDKLLESNDEGVSMHSSGLVKLNVRTLNSPALHTQIPINKIIKSENPCTMNIGRGNNIDKDDEGSAQSIIYHDDDVYKSEDNLNDTSISMLLDDASEASKNATIPLRRSPRRKSLVPSSYKTNMSSRHEEKENLNGIEENIFLDGQNNNRNIKPIIKSETPHTMNIGGCNNKDVDTVEFTRPIKKDYDDKENFNDISMLLDDESDASKKVHFPRRSPRRKSLVPLSVNTMSSRYGDKEMTNDMHITPRVSARKHLNQMKPKTMNQPVQHCHTISNKNTSVLSHSQSPLDSIASLPRSINLPNLTKDCEAKSVPSTPCTDSNSNSTENNSTACASKNGDSIETRSISSTVEEIPLGVNCELSTKKPEDKIEHNILNGKKRLRRSKRRRTLSEKGRLSLLQHKRCDDTPAKKVTQATSSKLSTGSESSDDTTPTLKANDIKGKPHSLVGSSDCSYVSFTNEDSTDYPRASLSMLETRTIRMTSKGRGEAGTLVSEVIDEDESSRAFSWSDRISQNTQLLTSNSCQENPQSKRKGKTALPVLSEDEVPSILQNADSKFNLTGLNISDVGLVSSEVDADSAINDCYNKKGKSSNLPSSSIKTKRRRRSSLRLHGGMVTLNEFTDLEVESAARKKKCQKNSKIDQVINKVKSQIISKENMRTSTTIKSETNISTEETLTSNIDENTSSQHMSQNDTKPICTRNDVGCQYLEKSNDYPIQPSDNNISAISSNDIKEDQTHEYVQDNSINFTSQDIEKCISSVFDKDGIVGKPCMSVRLFACLYLMIERQMIPKHVGNVSNDIRTNALQPILPFLQALVKAELASFGDKITNEGINKKHLHFCSFDYSTILTPVDIVDGSNQMTEDCIEALYDAVQEMKTLRLQLHSKEKLHLSECLLYHLHTFERKGIRINEECSKTMPFPWPKSRFSEASRHYCRIIRAVISSGTQNRSDYSPLSKHLGDLIGTAIRFYLRRFFNPIPYSPSNSKIEGTKIRSRVHLIVTMEEESSNVCSAAADGSISSVFGLALRSIDEFLELSSSKKVMGNHGYYNCFCERDASKKKLSFNEPLTDGDIEEIHHDITEAHIVLSGIRACKFIRNLLSWPGVSEAILDFGGWTKVEYFAKMYIDCKLHDASHDEKHLMLLENVEQLMQRLYNDAEILQNIEMKCEDRLKKLWKQFRCGTRETNLLRENPFIHDIRAHLKAGKHTHFPSLVSASSEK